jgi:hypothetical protein
MLGSQIVQISLSQKGKLEKSVTENKVDLE